MATYLTRYKIVIHSCCWYEGQYFEDRSKVFTHTSVMFPQLLIICHRFMGSEKAITSTHFFCSHLIDESCYTVKSQM